MLLHGFGGTAQDMTDPLTARGRIAFDRTATFPPYEDAGWQLVPPFIPVSGFFLDPPATSLTSWRRALLDAGFSTISYTQSGATIAPNVAQLTALAKGPLSTDSTLRCMRIAFVAHSRGGVIARSFLVAAAADPALARFLARVTSLVTLHSPHQGCGHANTAGAVAALVARVVTAMAVMGIPPPGPLTMLGAFVSDPALAELAVGSPTLAGIAAGEPVPGIAYHTFGGTSTVFSRLWAKVFTPDSTLPLPFFPSPIPLFHHGTTPVSIGAPLDAASFAPLIVGVPVPVVTELAIAVSLLAAATPELATGSGDLLVADSRAHLPFSATRGTNPLNHAEALWSPALQAQVVGILARLRTPGVSGQARARISPFPASLNPATHTVTASDAVSGVPLTAGTVTVTGTFDEVVLTAPLGAPFTAGFRGRRTTTIGPDGDPEIDVVFPTVSVSLPAPYGEVAVDLGAGRV